MAVLRRAVRFSLHRVRCGRRGGPGPFCGQDQDVHGGHQGQHGPQRAGLHRLRCGESVSVVTACQLLGIDVSHKWDANNVLWRIPVVSGWIGKGLGSRLEAVRLKFIKLEMVKLRYIQRKIVTVRFIKLVVVNLRSLERAKRFKSVFVSLSPSVSLRPTCLSGLSDASAGSGCGGCLLPLRSVWFRHLPRCHGAVCGVHLSGRGGHVHGPHLHIRVPCTNGHSTVYKKQLKERL